MFDLEISKLAMIGAVALVVIGPEKLPGVARTMGTLLGKAQRYVSDVKAEVNRSMELDQLRKMKESVETAATEVSQSVQSTADDFEKSWAEATGQAASGLSDYQGSAALAATPAYRQPKKNWRVKRAAVPRWYKSREGVRAYAQSGAARVARHRPKNLH
jgi:sec-independent protein translocase protein TatB